MTVKSPKFLVGLLTLILGDAISLALVTVIGFASHATLGTASFRMVTTYLPLLAAWLLIAPHLGAFSNQHVSDVRQLWRPMWAMILAAPLAAWMRGFWLDSPILPVFVMVIGGSSALAILIWRSLYIFLITRFGYSHG